MIESIDKTAPGVSRVHLFDTSWGPHLFAVNGSRVYQMDRQTEKKFRNAETNQDTRLIEELLEECGLSAGTYITDTPPEVPRLFSLSLSLSQSCNLGCAYCYSRGGQFNSMESVGGMSRQVALSAVETLFSGAKPGDRLNLSFMGGEPLVNRERLYETAALAIKLAEEKNVTIGFAITTNGTLLTVEDILFFEKYGFSVTVSLDGVGETHDRLRPFKDGSGSYHTIVRRIGPLLEKQGRMKVSARVTVTPQNMNLLKSLDEFIKMGFHSVGFSALLHTPVKSAMQHQHQDFIALLREMIRCGKAFESIVTAGGAYPFSNLETALWQIHRGTHRPYPCGAGAGYLGVSAGGSLYVCHRFVGDEAALIGHLEGGPHRGKQERWLAERHVHRQKPCSRCWARYLCGGGCYYEVTHSSRPACSYVRGWLDYCLQVYIRLLEEMPGYFRHPVDAAADSTIGIIKKNHETFK